MVFFLLAFTLQHPDARRSKIPVGSFTSPEISGENQHGEGKVDKDRGG